MTKKAMAAKPNIGPASPTTGSTSNGATNGPVTVPRPMAPASCAICSVRSSRVVRSAT